MDRSRKVLSIVFGGVAASVVALLAPAWVPPGMPVAAAVNVTMHGGAQGIRHASVDALVAAARNGAEWSTGLRPYARSSIWNTRVTNTTNPRLLPNSAQIIALAQLDHNKSPAGSLRTQEYGAPDAVSHPIVFATVRDPLVHTACTRYCNDWGKEGIGTPAQIRIPAKARPATGSDHHLAIVQPNGDEIDLWDVHDLPGRDWQTGDKISFGDGQNVGSFFSGPGQMGNGQPYNAATAGGAALGAGLIRESELANQNIPHALFMLTNCVAKAHVYPAIQDGDTICSGAGPHTPFGAHIWFSMSDASIDALPGSADTKTVMHALHQYGGYIMDSAQGNMDHTDGYVVMLEEGAQFGAFGVASPMTTHARAHGWSRSTMASSLAPYVMEYALPDTSGVDWSRYLRILDVCYAKKTC